MSDPATPPAVTYLFSDIEGSSRLWEADPERAAPALARHDAVSRAVVEQHRGTVVKMTGDGLHAAFADPADAVAAVVDLQLALAAEQGDNAVPLSVRCGLHLGSDQRRDNDYFGPAVNRAARIMRAAHGGQILLSQAVAERVAQRLPTDAILRDLGAVRLRDLTGPERVYQVVHPRLRTEFPALRSLASTPNNLPQQLNSFVGREREMREVRKLLARSRLVTLLAMGGIGKSRLSIQLGAEALDDYADGVWLVELAAIVDPREVLQAVASVLGVKEETGCTIGESLVHFVRDRELLLILDNCEQVVAGCAELTKRLLQAGARVKVLATTRDVLQVAGEAVYHLPTLSCPAPQDLDIDRLEQHAAVRLFLDRAVAAQPSFRFIERLAAPVAAICRRLDGIPLAIELAAARTRALSVDTIAARLDQRFRLLVSGDQTVLPRQRTLRALIDWSYDLLNEHERAAFERLSVFAGGWTLEDAEAVVGGDDIEAEQVMDLVTSLVEKSLAAMEADSGRYRMLDTVRHYASELLTRSGDESAARERHGRHFVDLAERARSELRGSTRGTWFNRLDAERDNLLAAFAWTEQAPGGDTLGLRLAQALRYYLINRGMPSVALQQAVGLLERPGLRTPTLERCKTLFAAGQVAYFMGLHPDARRQLSESLQIARDAKDESWVAGVLQPLGMACVGQGDYGAARDYLDEALQRAETIGRQELVGALNARAMLHRLSAETEAAERLYERALSLSRELDDQEATALVLLNLAIVAMTTQATSRACATLREALAIAQQAGSRPAVQSALEVGAGFAAHCGQWTTAAYLFGAAEAQAKETGLSRDPADEAFLAPLMSGAKRGLGDGFDAHRAEGRKGSIESALAAARALLQQRSTTC